MNCNNCIHYVICKMYHATDSTDYNDCVYFSNKNMCIKLPCEVGATYYTIERYCTEDGYYDEPTLHSITDCDYCGVECDKEFRILEHKFNSVRHILDKLDSINNTIFLDRNKANDKLTRLKISGNKSFTHVCCSDDGEVNEFSIFAKLIQEDDNSATIERYNNFGFYYIDTKTLSKESFNQYYKRIGG